MRRTLPVIAAALTSLALASCSGTEDSAQEATPTTVTSIVTAPADEPPQTTESPAPGNDGEATTEPPYNHATSRGLRHLPLQRRHHRAHLHVGTTKCSQHRLGLRRRQQLRPLR